jgi:hypothetical protein
MKSSIKYTSLTAIGLAFATMTGSAMAAAEFGANFELDNTARNGGSVKEAEKGLSQSGRVEIGVSAKAGDSVTVAAKTTLLTKKDGGVSTDDMWVEMAGKGAGIKLGRFEASDLFPLAGDTLVNHAGSVYGTNSLRGRIGNDEFHGAATLNLSESSSLEVGYIDGTKGTVAATSAKGVRAVLSLNGGAISGRIGFESGEYAPSDSGEINKIKGWGFTTTYDAGSFKLTGNYSLGQQNAVSDNRQTALGLSVAVAGLGLGVVNAVNDKVGGNTTVQTAYVSYSMPLFGVKGASWTPAVSRSTVKDSVTGVSNDENAVRVRVHYDF